MANLVVKVRRETIEACMTCPLCNEFFRDATTISECLHTFCRKCIYEKLLDEELESCPICNIDLGCVPLEKLRPDNSLQDVRAKIFPFKRRKVRAPELPSVTLPIRRKERSLSSLVAMTGRRTRGAARKDSALTSSVEKTVKKEEIPGESSSSLEIENKLIPSVKRSSSPDKPNEALPDKEIENGTESCKNNMDLWKPLNCLVEAANRTKSSKSGSQASAAKAEPTQIADRETQVCRIRRKSKVVDENHVDPSNLELEKPKKLGRIQRKRRANSEELGANRDRRFGPIWFSLVASEDKEGDASLPQIPVNYLRIKGAVLIVYESAVSNRQFPIIKGDVNIPVSSVQKYLMKKLNLRSETEVEIKCMGEPVAPSLQLYNLINLWVQSSSSKRIIEASIGSCAKDFVMVLSYSRRVY